MSFEVFQPAQKKNSYRTYQIEFRRLYAELLHNPKQYVIWTLNPKDAKLVAKSVGVRDKLSIRSDPRSAGVIIKLKEVRL